jgi:hypothetical protein
LASFLLPFFLMMGGRASTATGNASATFWAATKAVTFLLDFTWGAPASTAAGADPTAFWVATEAATFLLALTAGV